MKGKKIIKKIVLYFAAVIIAIPVLIFAFLSSSLVQTFIAQKFASYLSKELKTEVFISRLKVSLPLKVVAEDFFINDKYHNNILSSQKVHFKIKKLSFGKRKIEFSKIIFDKNNLSLVKYKNDSVMNYQFIIDYFTSKDTTTVPVEKQWKFSCKTFEVRNSNFKFQNQDKMNFIENGMDFNNIQLSQFNLKIDSIFLINDTVKLNIKNLSFAEKSGFKIIDLSTKTKFYSGNLDLDNCFIKTNTSSLNFDCSLKYNSPEDLNDFVNKVNLKTKFYSSRINTNDFGYFLPDFYNKFNTITFSGEVLGTVSNIKLRNFKFSYGKSTAFEGAISLNGLPNIEETFIRISVKKFTTIKSDIESLKLPGNNNAISIPRELLSFGNIIINGDFTGFYNDFNAYADFYTQNGNFSTDIVLKKNKKEEIEYKGHLYAKKFDIGKFLNISDVFGKLNLDAEINGSGVTAATAKVQVLGNVNRLEFKNNVYDSIVIKGEIANKLFNGYLNVQDDKIDLNFLGAIDMSSELPVFDFTALVSNAHLYQLKLIDVDSTGVLSTKLNFNFVGKKIDDIIGVINITDTRYKRHNELFKLDKLKLLTFNDSIGERRIEVNSDLVDAQMHGKFRFEDLPNAFNYFIKNYLPSLNITDKQQGRLFNFSNQYYFDAEVDLKNTYPISRLLMPNIFVSDSAKIVARFNSQTKIFNINCNADYVKFYNQTIKKWNLESVTDENKLYIRFISSRLMFNETMGLDNFKVFSTLQSDSVFYSFNWNDNLTKNKNNGDIRGFASFTNAPDIKFKIIRSDITVNDSVWHLFNENNIVYSKSRISINNFALGDENQYIKLNGNISDNPYDKLNIDFNHFNISYLDFLTVDDDIDLDGIVDGSIELFNFYKNFNFYSKLTINKLAFNKDKLGDLSLFSTWDDEKDGLFLKSNLIYTGNIGRDTTLFVNGYYFPNNKNEQFDIKVRLNHLKLRSLSSYFSSFSSAFDGQAMGNLSLKGNVKNPEIFGKLLLLRSFMKIDYLGVDYSISNSDSIEIGTNYFKFTNLHLYHSAGKATLDGKITHNSFRNILIDLNINFNNLMVLNTLASENDMFYGKAFASGQIKINGPDNNINLDIRAKTEKETSIYIPITNKTITHDNNFITFIQKEKSYETELETRNKFSGISMNFELEVKPEAEININLETPQTSGEIRAYGEGNIQLGINKDGEFKMYGGYTINDGQYFFTIQNIISKKFNIQNGGSIVWSGDPYDATVKMKAIYNLRASLYPVLLGTADNVSKKKVPVQNIISIEGNLTNPNIDFDIDLPTTEQEVKDRFFTVLDRNDKEQMLQQSFSLLVMNSFISQNRNVYSSSVGSGVGNSSSEVISNQISNWLSQISKDFDIGINYRPGDQLSSQELQLALSTQLFNDRVTVDGNFGMGGNLKTDDNSSSAIAKNTNNFVGDINIEVKITEDGRFRMKVFNRSNTNEFMNMVSPYTQGIGVFYRREFDNIKELFKSYK